MNVPAQSQTQGKVSRLLRRVREQLAQAARECNHAGLFCTHISDRTKGK